MIVITPYGTQHAYPTARHARPDKAGSIELFSDQTCTEWVATVPDTWLVAPKAPVAEEIDVCTPYQAKQEAVFLRRRTVRLFGLIPLFTISVV